MNRFVKITVLTLGALATVATSIQIADAGERYWRDHRGWHRRTVIIGVAPRVVVATPPRVIYREAPVVVDEAPVYDREPLYDDDDTVYADPDDGYSDRVYRHEAPETDEYAVPNYDDGDQSAYDDGYATQDDYFPERPASRIERNTTAIRKQAVIGKQPKKTATIKEADAVNLKPWTKEWRAYCADRFSTFNPQNGTYLGYDQKRHFCKAS